MTVDAAAISAGFGFLILGRLQWRWFKLGGRRNMCTVIANESLFSRTRGPKIVVLSIAVHILTVVIARCPVRVIVANADFEHVFWALPSP
jgi:hypothetical protein